MYRVIALFENEEHCLYEMYSDKYVIGSPILTEKVGKAGSFKFDIAITHPEHGTVIPYRTYITIFKDDVEYWHGRVIDAEEDFYRTKSVVCEGDLAFLNDSIIPVYQYSGDIPEYIDNILGMHNAQVESAKRIYRGNVEVVDSNSYMTRANQNFPDALSELTDKLIDTYGGYFRTRRVTGEIYLDYVYAYGKANAQELRIEENILDYTCKLGGDFCTRLIPLGAKPEDTGEEDPQRLTIASVNGGAVYVDNAELVAMYGVIVGTNIWDDVTDPVNLKLKGQSYINSQEFPKSLELTAVDLSNINVDIEALCVGCMTTVVSPFHDLSAEYFLSEKVSNLDSPESDYVSLGAEISTFTGKTSKRQQAAENQISKVERDARESIVDIGKTITGARGGYVILDTFDDSGKLVDPWQLLIMDRPDKAKAVNVIRMNQGGIAFSTSGYAGPYKSAWDINGKFVADFIQVGTMLADRIKGGTLTLGGPGNGNGIFKMLDALGTQIGVWEKDGIQMLTGGSAYIRFSPSSANAIEIVGTPLYWDTGESHTPMIALGDDLIRVYEDVADQIALHSELSPGGVSVFENDIEIAHYGPDIYASGVASIEGDLFVFGEKDRVVQTSLGRVKMAAYETTTPMFGDIGSGIIGEDGKCYISIDSIFAETVNVDCEYQVFLQSYGCGSVWVECRTSGYFVVSGDPGTEFCWEIKGRQAGYEQNRTDILGNAGKAMETVNYAVEAQKHIQTYMEGLLI